MQCEYKCKSVGPCRSQWTRWLVVEIRDNERVDNTRCFVLRQAGRVWRINHNKENQGYIRLCTMNEMEEVLIYVTQSSREAVDQMWSTRIWIACHCVRPFSFRDWYVVTVGCWRWKGGGSPRPPWHRKLHWNAYAIDHQ